MELALYCPNSGYYEQEQRPGRTGDFYTSVSIGPLFGRLLATEFTRCLEFIQADHPVIVEAGAHDGQLALDILSCLQSNSAPLWPRLKYCIIEPSARRRAWQAKTLGAFAARVSWVSDPRELGDRAVRGIIFSNELLDAFPVTRLRWSAARQQWHELGVIATNEGFEWRERDDPSEPIKPLLADAGLEIGPELEAVLPDGFILDLAADAARWWKACAEALEQGVLATIDYGFVAEALLHPSRHAGTLRAYHAHRFEPNVLARPGKQDLTAHVNFTQLQRAGEAAGLTTEPLQTQAQFLLPIATRAWSTAGALTPGDARQLQTLTHPEHLGHRFQVFLQRRNIAR